MQNKINLMISDFYNTFCKVEELSLKQDIKCLTMNEFHVIGSMGNKRLLMNELADILKVSMGTATVSVNKLVSKNFISRERDENDRRKVFVSLTKKGIIALNSHSTFHLDTIKAVTKDLSDKEIGIFLMTFSKLQNNLLEASTFSQPRTLKYFKENEKLKIVEIHGTRGLQDFFFKAGLTQGKVVKLIKKSENSIFLEFDDKVIDIDTKDSICLFAILYIE